MNQPNRDVTTCNNQEEQLQPGLVCPSVARLLQQPQIGYIIVYHVPKKFCGWDQHFLSLKETITLDVKIRYCRLQPKYLLAAVWWTRSSPHSHMQHARKNRVALHSIHSLSRKNHQPTLHQAQWVSSTQGYGWETRPVATSVACRERFPLNVCLTLGRWTLDPWRGF